MQDVPDILAKIAEYKRAEVAALKADISIDSLREAASVRAPAKGFARAIRRDVDGVSASSGKIGHRFPDQDGNGAHMNLSGAGVAAHAPNKDNAVRFLEFLASDTAQQIFAESNHEYPAVEGVLKNPVLDSWGNLNIDDINVSVLGTNNPEAVKIFDRVGWR